MSLQIGQRLGSHEVTGLLGKGGMGEVYRAHDLNLKREVAIKIIPDEFSRDVDRRSRFQREAEVLASLNHPNIAAIYDFEESNGLRFLVLELIEGETLADRLRRGPIPLHESLKIAEQIAEALTVAHEKGVVHRDLKPANVKITSDGTVKVLDFGLAKPIEKSLASGSLSDSPTMLSAVTQAGGILGTASYMSPEQAKGLNADGRSDIFALGSVLYEMLTGRRAFQGENNAEILAEVVARDPDLSVLPSTLNPRIIDLLRRAFEKSPKRRWHAAADVRGEIEAILADPRGVLIQPHPFIDKRPLWKRAIPVTIGLVVGTVLGGVAVWNSRSSAPSLGVNRFSFTLPNGQQFTSPTRQLLAISPDGTQLVYVANNRLNLKSSSALQSVLIQGTETFPGIQNPTFSPDGRFLAFWSADGTLKRIPVRGGPAITICKADAPYGMSWERNDEILFGAGPKGIMRVAAKGGTPETIVVPVSSQDMHGPQVLPGGKELLFTVANNVGTTGPARWDQAKIVVRSLESGKQKIIVDGGSDARYVQTGHLVYVLRGALLAVPFDVSRTEVTGPPVPLVEGVRIASVPANATTGTAQFSFSENGTLVYIPEPAANFQRQLGLVDLNGRIKPLDVPAAPYLYPRISPDAKQLSVATDDTKESITWVYTLSGAMPLRRLTFGGRNDNAVWSADGQWLIMRSNSEGGSAGANLFRQRADGTGTPERVTEALKAEVSTSQSPGSGYWSGPNQIFTQTIGSEYDLWSLSTTDKKATPFDATPGSEQINGGFSPDGRWVAYSSNETGRFEIYLRPFSGSIAKFQITRDGGSHPQWAPNGKQLYFDNRGTIYSVAIQFQPTVTWAIPAPLPITGFYQPDVRPRHYDLSPDGKQFVMIFTAQALTQTTEPSQIHYVLNWFEELRQTSR